MGGSNAIEGSEQLGRQGRTGWWRVSNLARYGNDQRSKGTSTQLDRDRKRPKGRKRDGKGGEWMKWVAMRDSGGVAWVENVA